MQKKVGDILVVGTAHVSEESAAEVEQAIKDEDPDVVAVELCDARYKALTNPKRWEQMKVTQVLKQKKMFLVLVQLILQVYQRRLSKEIGDAEPGTEFLRAIKAAKKKKKKVVLADRDITLTFKRAYQNMGIVEKFKLLWFIITGITGAYDDEIAETDLKQMMKEDMITTMVKDLRKFAPTTTKVLIDERDAYLAGKIHEASKGKKKVVAVIGAGHLNGVVKYLKKPKEIPDLKKLEEVDKRSFPWLTIVAILIPLFFIGATFYALFTGNVEVALRLVILWFLINGVLAAIGTALARGHPFAILAAFVAAPFTSLNPFLAAGWIAGYVQAVVDEPRVEDLRGLGKLEGFMDFYKNRFVRVLLVAALANLGSTAGTFIMGWLSAGELLNIIF